MSGSTRDFKPETRREMEELSHAERSKSERAAQLVELLATAMSSWPRREATTEVTSSGVLVPVFRRHHGLRLC